jgi:hypothetical protein
MPTVKRRPSPNGAKSSVKKAESKSTESRKAGAEEKADSRKTDSERRAPKAAASADGART